jgi:REP element-mobilizing transposase RayT
MPRAKRIHYEGAVYHVTSRGNERRKIVIDDSDRGLFLKILAEVVEEHHLHCHAWVLMDNHYHLLLETPAANLSIAMKHLNGLYTQRFNRKRHRVGHLFQGRFKAIHVEKESYLKELCRYLVLNPVRAKMVKHPKEWKWSSYRATAGIEKTPTWLETKGLLGLFDKRLGSAQKAYQRFVADGIKVEYRPWDELRHQVYLGKDEFLGKMKGLISGKENLDMPKYQKKILHPPVEKVLGKVAVVYGVKNEEITKSRKKENEARDVAIYLLKKTAGISSKETARVLGVSASAIGNRWAMIKIRVVKDRQFGKMIRKCQMLS